MSGFAIPVRIPLILGAAARTNENNASRRKAMYAVWGGVVAFLIVEAKGDILANATGFAD